MFGGPSDGDIQTLVDRCGEDLDDALRLLGLYSQHKQIVSEGDRVAVVVTVQVGDLAFREAEPEPNAAEWREAEIDKFLDARNHWLPRP